MHSIVPIIAVLLAAASACAAEGDSMTVRVTVSSTVENPVDSRLFGQFLERPSWGETGPEAAFDPATRSLRSDILPLLDSMCIPVIRFPGGTDVDFLDWTDMIDGVPGREGGRPTSVGHRSDKVTNRFGLDEYFRLRESLGSETILVVNLLDGLARRRPLNQAALHAAGLVAYANAPVGAALPAGMPDWPAIRAANGRREPYAVEYVQIGNEWSMPTFSDPVRKGTGLDTPAALADWYIECLRAYITAIRAVDPRIEIIVDNAMDSGIEETVLSDPFIRREVSWQALHAYAPGPMNRVSRDGKPYTEPLKPEEFWYAAVTMPGSVGPAGQSVWPNAGIAQVRSMGHRVACTEWNWNGWASPPVADPKSVSWRTAAALGAAGFLHALMREGETVRMATQSMLVGHRWGITAVQYDPAGEDPSHYLPQGAVTTFYNLHHGAERLKVSIDSTETIAQPFSIGWAAGATRPALVDVIATRGDGRLFVHIINRHFSRPASLSLTLDGLTRSSSAPSSLHLAQGRDSETVPPSDPSRYLLTRSLPLPGPDLPITIPERSLAILEIPLQ